MRQHQIDQFIVRGFACLSFLFCSVTHAADKSPLIPIISGKRAFAICNYKRSKIERAYAIKKKHLIPLRLTGRLNEQERNLATGLRNQCVKSKRDLVGSIAPHDSCLAADLDQNNTVNERDIRLFVKSKNLPDLNGNGSVGKDDLQIFIGCWKGDLSGLTETPNPNETTAPGTPIPNETPAPGSPTVAPTQTPPNTPAPGESQNASFLSQHGITWTFDRSYQVGQFVNGDWWVVGPVTINSISPIPSNGRNGWTKNPMPGFRMPYDNRVGRLIYDSSLQPSLPALINGVSSVVSTISNPSTNCTRGQSAGWLSFEGECNLSPIKTVAILTVVNSVPPANSLRPPYIGTSYKPIFTTNNVRRDLLLNNRAAPSNVPTLQEAARLVERPGLDYASSWVGYEMRASDCYSSDYGASIPRDAGDAALRLLVTTPSDNQAGRDKLMFSLIQRGIDNYGIVRNGGDWPSDGGHSAGRKLFILMAGLLLEQNDLKNVEANYPDRFGEDGQTYYDGQGFPRWTIVPDINDETNDYRYCCTSGTWIGQALAARMLKLEQLWGHQAFFDYVDRWMDSDGGISWGSNFQLNMWNMYRGSINTCINGVRDRCSIGCRADANQAPTQFIGENAVDQGGGC